MRIICAWKFDLRMKLHSWSHAGRYWRNILVTVPTFLLLDQMPELETAIAGACMSGKTAAGDST